MGDARPLFINNRKNILILKNYCRTLFSQINYEQKNKNIYPERIIIFA